VAVGIEERIRAQAAAGRASRRRVPTPSSFMPYLLVAPASFYMLALLGYPLLLAVYFSISNSSVQESVGTFVGLRNYGLIIGDAQFQKAQTTRKRERINNKSIGQLF